MGSTGGGSLTDYSKRKPANGGDRNGGSSGTDDCKKAFNADLEDVSRCFYYINYEKVPPVDTVVNIFFNGIRLAAETMNGEELGYLPTKFNYVKICMSNEFSYKGLVKASSLLPLPSITVDIIPNE